VIGTDTGVGALTVTVKSDGTAVPNLTFVTLTTTDNCNNAAPGAVTGEWSGPPQADSMPHPANASAARFRRATSRRLRTTNWARAFPDAFLLLNPCVQIALPESPAVLASYGGQDAGRRCPPKITVGQQALRHLICRQQRVVVDVGVCLVGHSADANAAPIRCEYSEGVVAYIFRCKQVLTVARIGNLRNDPN
jgi:hypothetical protein